MNGVMYLPAAGPHRRARAGDRQGDLAVSGHRRRAFPARRRVLAGDGSNPPRIIFTAGRRLIALNANTGKIDPGFGKEGEVDMVVPYNSVPLVYRNMLVVGANSTAGPIGGIGNPRAFDARTGAKLWEFSSVPQPGEVGHDTWEGDSWKDRSGVERLAVLLHGGRAARLWSTCRWPRPFPDFYGGDRKGANLFGNSVVAVDVKTGQVQMAFSDHPSRYLGSRSARASGIVRHRAKTTDHSRAGLDHEIRLHVHPESRNRPADFRRGGAPGAK